MPLPERELIRRIRNRLPAAHRSIAIGIGDDCAVLQNRCGFDTLVTTDFSLEGVHFRREWQSPECIGHRCLARGLSDIAAMGGTPVAAFLSLALPGDIPEKWVNRFFDGFLALARRHKTALAGGDTAQSPGGVLIDVMVVGKVKSGKGLLRSGAKVGDRIYVTGDLGESAAALELLARGNVRRRNVFPQPRLAVGEWLSANRVATSAIDISDGLSTDLTHICQESAVGAVIEADAIPIHPSARKLSKSAPSSTGIALDLALHGGEDYELLFTATGNKRVPPRIAGVKITRIGEIVRENRIALKRDGRFDELRSQGWEHFRRC